MRLICREIKTINKLPAVGAEGFFCFSKKYLKIQVLNQISQLSDGY
jgi:hypothetical protein